MNVIRTMATQLVFLKDVERLSPTVIRILGGNPSKVRYPMRLHDLDLAMYHRLLSLFPQSVESLSDAVLNVQFTLQGPPLVNAMHESATLECHL